MSKQFLNQYYNQVHEIRRAGITNEGALSMPFFFLIMQYAQAKKYQFHSQITIKSKKTNKNIRPDGILMNGLRVHRGYWESKDLDDDIDTEIKSKLYKDGYPSSNILFEDTQTAVLIQGGEEVMRVEVNDANKLHEILTAFINYQPAEVQEFEQALAAFKEDIPKIVQTFRLLFNEQNKSNKKYVKARNRFLDLCKEEINPNITAADIREMLIQHILTEDLFMAIFDDASFLKFNIIAKELEGVINTVLTREVRKNQLGEIRHYYQTLNTTAASIADHNEKQKFLKTVYENFYKVYNPKGADRLGVVYTPNEIVRFMVQSTDYLLEKHFNKNLYDKGVEILDPATGTGTFITDIIDYIPPQYLPYKYKNELHANEVSILPYYIANLNIEYTYQQKMGKYIEFENICFVDTLDNTKALSFAGKQHLVFGFNSENTQRIKRQNDKPISVVIGNPPYNANQQNFNDFNKNRSYPIIDKRIKDTFVKQSTAQKTKMYDMYARFYRWAMDRVDKNGVIAFITNRSFIDSRTFDGFRKIVQDEFDYAYILDTKSDVRANPKIAGTSHNVFGIQTGVAILFLVRLEEKKEKSCQIRYATLTDEMLKEEKLDWIKNNSLRSIAFERIKASKKNNWINLANNDFEDLLPLADKKVKAGKSKEAVFKLFSLGVVTARDEWVYDFNKNNLTEKVNYLIDTYNSELVNFKGKSKAEIKDIISKRSNRNIKWTRAVINDISKNKNYNFDENCIVKGTYRPFTKKHLYFSKQLNEMQYQLPQLFYKHEKENLCISFVAGSRLNFDCLITNDVLSYAIYSLDPAQCLPFYTYDKNGNRQENITNWGLQQFATHYKDELITKEAIFHYTYGVLHYPAYRQKYELNLKREFPRLPFYKDFWKWSSWGKQLMDLHLNYEIVEPYAFRKIDKKLAKDALILPKLRAKKAEGIIVLDSKTELHDVPPQAWSYKLGNRSALEWILDQYKEKKPRDKTIAEKFNTYRFADYKSQVIDLLERVCTVSVRTMKIVAAMKE
ncbi:MAG: type ISP restriction/modification enzyme [Chitinophagales bacterium]